MTRRSHAARTTARAIAFVVGVLLLVAGARPPRIEAERDLSDRSAELHRAAPHDAILAARRTTPQAPDARVQLVAIVDLATHAPPPPAARALDAHAPARTALVATHFVAHPPRAPPLG